MPLKISAQFVCPSPKFSNFGKKSSLWVSVAPQNERLNLSFVKDFYVNDKKLARNGRVVVVTNGR
jgi:hypothetical protein